MPRLFNGDALNKEAEKLWSELPDGEELSKELMKLINHAPTIGGWISVDNAMPGIGVVVLAYEPVSNNTYALYLDECRDWQYFPYLGQYDGKRMGRITHWRHLPKTPKEAET